MGCWFLISDQWVRKSNLQSAGVAYLHIAMSWANCIQFTGTLKFLLLHHHMSKMSIAWQVFLLTGGMGHVHLPCHVTGREMCDLGTSQLYFLLLDALEAPEGFQKILCSSHPAHAEITRLGDLHVLLYPWCGFTPSLFSITPALGFMYPEKRTNLIQIHQSKSKRWSFPRVIS